MFCRIAAIVVLSLALPAIGQDKKPGDAPGELFFTGKGQTPLALERIYPGITAALNLTDEQKTALREAMERTIHDPALREAGQKLKSDPAAATEADRASVLKAHEQARAQLKEAVDKTLSAEQKALIIKIQGAFEESQKAAMATLQAEFGAAKGNADRTNQLRQQMQQELRAEMAGRLDKILDAEQKKAVDVAATIQRDREEDAAKSKGAKSGKI